MSDDKEKRSLRCGLLNIRPQFLQKFNSAKWFFAFFCLAFLVHHMTNTMISVNLSTIEKRFELSSTKSSFIINAYDIACAATVMFISHFCRHHKPKWIGIGIIIMGIGALIFTIPHVAETVTITTDGLAPVSQGVLVPGSDSALCSATSGLNGSSNATECIKDDSPSSSRWYFIFIIGALLFGLGGTPVNALGPPFLDEIFPPEQVGAYYGVMGSMSCLGPIFGFAFGGFMLKYYVDFSTPEGIDPSHYDWIGAWWTGFIMAGIIAVMSAIPLIMFPRKLPEADEVRTMKIAKGLISPETTEEKPPDEKMSALEMAKEFWPHLKSLFTNGAFMCCTLSQAFTGFLIGACSFLPKLVQIGLKFEASQASFYLGSVLVTAAGGGYLIGGLMAQKLKMTGRSAAKYAFIFSICGFAPCFGMLLHCPGVELGEPTVSGGLVVDPIHPLDPGYGVNMCADSCVCPKTYDPVCGKDVTFYSPCHAGCTDRELVDGLYYKFSNCSCLMTDTLIVDVDNSNSSHANHGKCYTECETYVPVIYLGSAFLTLFFCFLAQPASMLALNRSVSSEHLSMAYGIRNLLFRAVGTIPGPVAFGIIIDSACAVWQRGCDGSYGSCWEHDTTKLIYSVTGAFIAVKILSDVFLLLTWKLYPKSGSYSQDNSATTSSADHDPLAQYVVKMTDDSELLEIDFEHRSSSVSRNKRLSDYIRSGLESGKVFMAMAHETIV